MEIRRDFEASDRPSWIERSAYREGWISYQCFCSASENPNEEATKEFYSWYQGWFDAHGKSDEENEFE